LDDAIILKIYPNPATNRIYIQHASKNDSFLDIQNGLGELVFHIQLNPGINELNISQLKNGLYILKVRGENIQVNLIKQ
jgi:hypothetical protein